MKYRTQIVQTGNNTGIAVSEEILEKLGGGKRPLVIVTLNNHSYRSAVGKMNGKYIISLSAENRTKANVKGGDILEIDLDLDTAPRTVEVPDELQQALDKNATAKTAFDKLAFSKKKAHVLSISSAKTAETRKRRIEKIVEQMQ